MYNVFVAIISCLFLLAGIVGVYETRLYDSGDRTEAPRLFVLYTFMMGLVGLAGAACLLWLLSGRSLDAWVFTPILIVSALPTVVQYWMHRKMGRNSSPLPAHVSDRFRERYGDES
ncbi:hypothetical protein [Halostagnicola bangensis]